MSTSYEHTVEELKKIKKAQQGNLQNHQKGQNGAFDGFDGTPQAEFEKKGDAGGKAAVSIAGKVSTREEWDFSKLLIPSQTHPGRVDIWMCGTRLDRPGFQFWFVRSGNQGGRA